MYDGYLEAQLVVNGETEEVGGFLDWVMLEDWAHWALEAVEAEGLHGEVYVIWHHHPPQEKCECAPPRRPYMTTETV